MLNKEPKEALIAQPFTIIGGQRCATGWLSRCISEHPEIFVAGDELRIFERNYNPERDWCKAIKAYPNYRGERVFGEKTANYLTDLQAAERIRRHVPTMRMIAILRDPVERMVSQFRMSKKQAGPLSLKDFTRDESFWENMIDRGRYASHLRRFYALFPHDQVKVVIYEDRKQDPFSFIQDIFRYLGVDDTVRPFSANLRTKPSSTEGAHVLRNLVARLCLHRRSPLRQLYSRLMPLQTQEFDSELIAVCRDRLGDEVTALEELLGRSLKHWQCHQEEESK